MNPRPPLPPLDDEQLARLLSAVDAPPEPTVWARARQRILTREAGERAAGVAPAGWFGWLARPAALAAAVVLLAATIGIMTSSGMATAPRGLIESATAIDTRSLSGALLAEADAVSAVAAGAGSSAPAPAGDSGAAR